MIRTLSLLALILVLSACAVQGPIGPVADATSSASAEAEELAVDATSASSEAGAEEGTQVAPPAGINLYDLALGPLFVGAWVLFALGLGWRILGFTRLTRVVPRQTISADRVVKTDPVMHGVQRWGRRTVFATNPVTGVVSLVFHVLLFLVPLLLPAHVDLLAASLGVDLPTLPAGPLDNLTLVFIVLGGFFLLRRLLVPSVRALTTLRDYGILLLTAAPFISAYMAHHHWLNYHTVVLVHMLIGDAVIAVVPWTRLGHMPFLILSRFFVAGELAWKPGNRRW